MEQSSRIGAKIKLLSTALAQEMNRNTAALDLTASQSFFLHHLVLHEGEAMYPRDLEKAFEFSHPTVSGILRRMEAKGFIAFRPGEQDRRCKQIMLTEKALQCHGAMLQHMQTTESAAVRGMTDSEVAELGRLLDLVIANLGAARSDPFAGLEEPHD